MGYHPGPAPSDVPGLHSAEVSNTWYNHVLETMTRYAVWGARTLKNVPPP